MDTRAHAMFWMQDEVEPGCVVANIIPAATLATDVVTVIFKRNGDKTLKMYILNVNVSVLMCLIKIIFV